MIGDLPPLVKKQFHKDLYEVLEGECDNGDLPEDGKIFDPNVLFAPTIYNVNGCHGSSP